MGVNIKKDKQMAINAEFKGTMSSWKMLVRVEILETLLKD